MPSIIDVCLVSLGLDRVTMWMMWRLGIWECVNFYSLLYHNLWLQPRFSLNCARLIKRGQLNSLPPLKRCSSGSHSSSHDIVHQLISSCLTSSLSIIWSLSRIPPPIPPERNKIKPLSLNSLTRMPGWLRTCPRACSRSNSRPVCCSTDVRGIYPSVLFFRV